MQNKYGDEVEFIGVAGKYEREDVEFFIEKFWVDGFPHLIDSDGSIFEAFGITGHPTIAFVDTDGTTDLVVGSVSPQLLERRLDELLS